MQDAQYLANLQQQLDSQQTMYAQLAKAVGDTQAQALQSTQKANAQVLDPALVPPANTLLLVIFTVLLGLLLGLGLIFGWEYFDRSLRTSAPLEEAFGSLAVVSVAARPSVRELRQVAPAAWAQPALPTAASRSGHWPVGTLALAAVAASLPRAQTEAHRSTADTTERAAGNGQLNGHAPVAEHQLNEYDGHDSLGQQQGETQP